MKAYFISGLGADKRVFKYISLPDGYDVIYLDWIVPLNNETLTEYSLRMAENIDMSNPFLIIGLSMGGMIASEIARHFKPVIIILISSIPSASHLPPYFKASGKLRLFNWVPVHLLKSLTIINRLFRVESVEDRELLKDMVKSCDESFIRWGMMAISTWKTNEISFQYYHIHGSWDRLLPIRYTRPTHIILRGGHFMVMNRSKEISRILAKLLEDVLKNENAINKKSSEP